MTRARLAALALAAVGFVAAPAVQAAEIVIFGFEGSLEDWAIPEWAKLSSDYGGEDLVVSDQLAKEGTHALELRTTFPGGCWTGAYVERLLEVTDWSAFGRLSASVYLPPEAPQGLRGRVILTVGDQWRWTEMNRGVLLTPGAWTNISVNLKPGSMDWSFFPDDAFRKDVRKLGLRIEANPVPYSGSVFIDDVRLAEE